MKFTKLRLLGFKSFVDSTDFLIEPGLTAIVGPNGCGKSNLVEALRWTMGENSYKNMRASGMDDVIFSGSFNRPARNSAEVTLHLDNQARKAPAAFNDSDQLEVSRRITRGSGSQYRINGKEVRARDVQLLFADASTGARSPALVGQGQISQLIAAKPVQRRALLEEAAGISGLHTRRHEAELRLRAAEQNLERLDDIIGQLHEQLDRLKRQSRQASRYRNLSADIRTCEASLYYVRWSTAETARQEAHEAMHAAKVLVGEAAEAQTRTARDQAVAANHIPALRDGEAEAAARFQRVSLARSNLDQEEAQIKTRLDHLQRQLRELEEDIAREKHMVADNDGILQQLGEEEAQLQQQDDGTEQQIAAARTALSKAQSRLRETDQKAQNVTDRLAEGRAYRDQLTRLIADYTRQRQSLAGRMDKTIAERDSLLARTEQDRNGPDLQEQVASLMTSLQTGEQALQNFEKVRTSAQTAEMEARKPVREMEQVLNRLRTEAKTLLSILEPVARQGRHPAVLEAFEVPEGYETALGAVLGDDLEAPFHPDAPIYWREDLPNITASTDPALPPGVTALGTLISAPPALARRLRQIGLVDDHDGAALQGSLAPGQRLVSKTGALWRWDGFTQSADAPSASAQRLAQKNRLQTLEIDIQQADTRLQALETEWRRAKDRTHEATQNEQKGREHARALRRQLDQARDALARHEKQSSQWIARLSALEAAHQQLAESQKEAAKAQSEAEHALADAPELDSLQASLTSIRMDIATQRADVAERRGRLQGLERDQQARIHRLQTIARERKSWAARVQNAATHIATLETRRQEAQEEQQQLAERSDEIARQRRLLLNDIDKADQARREAADALAKGETLLADADRLAREALDALAKTRETSGRAEERHLATIQRSEDIAAQILDALNCSPQDAARMAGLSLTASLPDAADLERRLNRLKMERERLGGVNLRADQEAEEIRDKHDTLVHEREDLIEAIQQLRRGIANLNQEGRERLLAAFDHVNQHFKDLFTKLFGGGTAELQLTESDDPLKAGLEILARPPGKKPQTMTLLSGGEQTLTATALIFAVFLTNPAPICVLDEVDAPLDDANVERYCDLLHAMKAMTDTRFVLITHNPLSMARVDRLFGVTMAERGVSQLVSVDLATAETYAEAG